MSEVDALRACSEHLAEVAGRVDEAAATSPAYPSEWTIADTFSHMGSSAVIWSRRMAAALGGEPFDDEFSTATWDEWNVMSPAEQVKESVEVNSRLQHDIDGLDADARERFQFTLGPITTDFAGAMQLRLNELTAHVWDVEVAVDSTAGLYPGAVPYVVDNLELIAGWTATPTRATRSICVRTTDPVRHFRIDLSPDKVGFESGDEADVPDLTMPAEAFVRLVYGRLDAAHTPPFEGDPSILEELRSVYPGL